MGDNLLAARQFTDECHGHLVPLLSAPSLDKTHVTEVLSAIKCSAKDMNARAIFRAAQTAIEEFGNVQTAAQTTGALLALNKLVCQYTEGLNEVAPVINEETLQDIYEAERLQWREARETFLPLQRFAQNAEEASLLSVLANLHPAIPGEKAVPSTESFDELMTDITDESLRNARESEKSVSVSYATDEILMDQDLADAAQAALIDICNGLIHRSVEDPKRRQTQGLSGAAHIAITAKRQGDFFDILVSCEGPAPSENLLTGSVFDALREWGAELSVSGSEKLARVDISGLPVGGTEFVAAPLKTAMGMTA